MFIGGPPIEIDLDKVKQLFGIEALKVIGPFANLVIVVEFPFGVFICARPAGMHSIQLLYLRAN